ncbi:hypothetical protein [Thermogemmatispora sp.]|uniref:hypothetical protein n=1 Tax=Thermogemmatispora sp. TaxID=1968838 RepID=UPI0035E464E9
MEFEQQIEVLSSRVSDLEEKFKLLVGFVLQIAKVLEDLGVIQVHRVTGSGVVVPRGELQ